MTKVIYAPAAQADLVEIGGYIAQDSERNAEKFVAELRAKALRIAQMPRIYKIRDEFATDIRSAAFGNHLILFRTIDSGIEVLHIIHGARDLKRLFET